MNERFASEPDALRGHLALKYLLEKFGPLTGRYLTAYPKTWREQVEKLNADLGTLEVERVKTLLRRAKEDMRIVGCATIPYDEGETWLQNSKRHLESRPRRHFAGVVIAPRLPPELYHDVFELENMQLPPTAEERIAAAPEEFVRVSSILLLASPELGFVDPYINPCNRFVSPILRAMIEHAAKGVCENIRIWVRSSVALSDGNSVERIHTAMDSLVPKKPKNALRVELNLLEDDRGIDRMHARYLLSARGGIRFDQGFQTLPSNRRVDVAPLSSKTLFDEVWLSYFENRHGYKSTCKPIVITRNPTK